MSTQFQSRTVLPFKRGNRRTRSSFNAMCSLSLERNSRNAEHFKLSNFRLKQLLSIKNDPLVILEKIHASPKKKLRVEEDIDSDFPTISKNLTRLKPKQMEEIISTNGSHYSSTTRSLRNTSRVSEQFGQEIKNLDEDKEMKEIIDKAKHKRKISLSHQPKSESFAKKLAAAISTLPSKKSLKKLKLRNCVTPEFLEIFLRDIDSREIRTLDLSGNRNLDLRVVERLRNKIKSEVLDLSDTELNAKEIETLGEMKELKELSLNYKAFKHRSIATALVKLINNGLQVLSLVDSKITERQLQKIAKGLKDRVSLRVLDLSHVALKKNGVNSVATIVNKSEGMDKLVLSNCAITTTLLMRFKKLVKHEVTELDVSSNNDLANGHLDVLSSLVDKVNCQALDISSISLDGNKIRELLKTTPPKHLKKLSMVENPDIDFVAVGELVTQWRILELDISECRHSLKAIVKLANSIEDHELNSIDISDPMGTANDEKRKALQALSRKTKNLIFGNLEEWH